MRRFGMVLSFILTCSLTVSAQQNPDRFILSLQPGIAFPLSENQDIMEMSWGAGLRAYVPVRLVDSLALRLGGGISYRFTSTTLTSSLSMVGGGGLVGLEWQPHQRFSLVATGGLGYFYSFFNSPDAVPAETNGGGGMFIIAEGGVAFFPADRFSIGLTAGWQGDLNYRNTLILGVDFSYRFPSRTRASISGEALPCLELQNWTPEEIFPVQYNWYENHPVGFLDITNTSDKNIRGLQVSFIVEEFMSAPAVLEAPESVKKGENANLTLYGLFNKNLLDVTERTKASGLILLNYTIEGLPVSQEFPLIFDVHDRNAISWTDDRKAAAFITTKDPTVLGFSKVIAGIARNAAPALPDSNTRYAMAMYEALRLYGMHYVVDPSSSYVDLSTGIGAVDYLQFPRQSLGYRGGDCDDLTILYCALLESIDIETALITVPGHILAAYALESPNIPASLEAIERNGRFWVPVELTALGKDFITAVEIGGSEWERNPDSAELLPVHLAWEEYPAVGLPGEALELSLPEEREIETWINSVLQRMIDEELNTGKQAIRDRYGEDSLQGLNSLGVLYARYGYLREAEEYFRSAVTTGDYQKSRINLGNLALIRESWNEALEWFESADESHSGKPAVLLGMARSYYALGNHASAEDFHHQLEQVNPRLAEKYSWLAGGETGALRAGRDMGSGGVEWEE